MTKYGDIFFQITIKRNKIQSQIALELSFSNGFLYINFILTYFLTSELHSPVKGHGLHIDVLLIPILQLHSTQRSLFTISKAEKGKGHCLVHMTSLSLSLFFCKILWLIFVLGLSNPSICFSTWISRDIYLGENEAVKYDEVLTNIGNGYDRLSGHFKSPIKGLYVISCTVMASSNDALSVVLVKNGHILSNILNAATANYESGAISIQREQSLDTKIGTWTYNSCG